MEKTVKQENSVKQENGSLFVKLIMNSKALSNTSDWYDYSAWEQSWPNHAEYAVGMMDDSPIY